MSDIEGVKVLALVCTDTPRQIFAIFPLTSEARARECARVLGAMVVYRWLVDGRVYSRSGAPSALWILDEGAGEYRVST